VKPQGYILCGAGNLFAGPARPTAQPAETRYAPNHHARIRFMPTYRYLMFTNAVEGRDADFNTWYDGIHIPDIMAVEGFKSFERFKVVDSPHTPGREHSYAAIYELEGDDPNAVLDRLVASFTSGKMRMTDTMDFATGRPILLETLA
jgi:hypothetical protein